jgi:hypothetical protein
MQWNCPECGRANSAEVDSTATGVVHRYCTYCGFRAGIDAVRGAPAGAAEAETGQVPSPKVAQKVGAGRPVLVLLHGRKAGAELPLPVGRIRIGSDGADWDFPEEGLAPVHFQIDFLLGRCSVRDLTEGEVGITVNAKPTSFSELRNGDQIRAGRATFLFLTIWREESHAAAEPRQTRLREAVADEETIRIQKEKGKSVWEEAGGSPDVAAATVIVPKDRVVGGDATAARSAAVEIASGPESGHRIPLLFDSNVVGRGLCEVPLGDPLASARHAEIGRQPDGLFFLKDLASSNGTFLNGRQIQYSPLHDGDVIQVGDTLLRFLEG